MFTATQLGRMLKIQNDMQCAQLGENWKRETDHNYSRAIVVEAAEAMDHVGYKWWKDTPINIDQLRMEVIDMLHFELCFGLQNGASHESESATEVAAGYIEEEFNFVPKMDPTKENFLAMLDNVIHEAQRKKPVMSDLLCLFKTLNMTGDDVYKAYIGKNILNQFRRANGYKEGTYQKIWAGLEDNEVLTVVLSELNGDTADLPEVLMQELQVRYDLLNPKS